MHQTYLYTLIVVNKTILSTYLRSCSISLALYSVMSDVVAAGMMMMGVRDTRLEGCGDLGD